MTAASEIEAKLQGLEAILHNLAEQISTDRLSGEALLEPNSRNQGGDSGNSRPRRSSTLGTGCRAGWSEPVLDAAEDRLMATYSTPFFELETEGERASLAGVAYLKISMEPVHGS